MTSAVASPWPGTGQPVEAYLADVAAVLPGPRVAHAGIVAELRAGLLDAIDAYRTAGVPPAQAEAEALREFGDPRQIAAAFGPELAARSARRTALALVATGPMIGLLWTAAAVASHIGIRDAQPWHGAPPGSLVAFPLAVAVLAVSVWATLFTVAGTGRLARCLPQRPRRAPATAAVAGFGIVAVDMIVLALLASQLVSAPGTLAPVPVIAAACASLTRLALAPPAARRCLRVRAALA